MPRDSRKQVSGVQKSLRTAESVWGKVAVGAPDACWPWQGSLDSNGYGQHWHDGRLWMVHRDAYTTRTGPIPKDLTIDHLCFNKVCCNPAHLEAVTPKENTRRMRRVLECPSGHPYDDANTYVRKFDGAKVCRECRNAYRRKRRAERKEGVAAKPVGAAPGRAIKRVARTYRPEAGRDGGPGCPGQTGEVAFR